MSLTPTSFQKAKKLKDDKPMTKNSSRLLPARESQRNDLIFSPPTWSYGNKSCYASELHSRELISLSPHDN